MKIIQIIFILVMLINSVSATSPNVDKTLTFTNRAHCALDSKKPTDSVLVLLSNMDIGRSLYRLAKVRGENTNEFTKLGLSKYRYTVLGLIDLIHKKIINNKLPLLPSDLSSPSNLSKYSYLSKACENRSKCPELDAYLESLWNESNNSSKGLAEIDNFNVDNFLNLEEKNIASSFLRCNYLKKFTPLEAHLFGTKPGADVLEQIAVAAKNINEFYSDCHDYSIQESLKVSTYELSLGLHDSSAFLKKGFDYWNTLKIYFSWAFRNSHEASQMAYPFDEIFAAVLIEDSLFMIPNGCKSLTNPKCDKATLNQNSMRMFARHDFKQSVESLDFFRAVPEGSSSKLLEDQFPVVNQDILSFAQFETADLWTDSFRQNFSETRLTMRKKFVSSLTSLNLMMKNLKSDSLSKDLYEYFKPVLLEKKSNNLGLKSELYYLCAESTFISSEDLSYLRPKLDILGKIITTNDLTSSINSKSVNDIFEYYQQVSKNVNSFCSSFDQDSIFNGDFSIDRTGFNRWYVDTVYEGKIASLANILRKEKLQTKKPMLAYGLYNKSKDIRDVICIDSVDCARLAIQSIVDIYAVNQYSEIFLNMKNEISSSSMLNPYAERTACKVYDPWFKTKASLFGFGTDIAQAAISAVTPGLVYGNFDLQPGKVTSFNQLVKDGKIVINSKYEKEKILASVALDLGAMTDIPCSISISKSNEVDPSKILGFRGVTIRACRANEKNVIQVETNNEMGENTKNYNAGCLQCSLDFEHISTAMSNVIPYGRTAFFMARAVIRLYRGLKDPFNVPKSWEVNTYLTKAAYDSHGGKIPNECVAQLIKGKSCMKNLCEENVLDTLKLKGVIVENIDSTELWRGSIKVKMAGCDQINTIKVFPNQDNEGRESCSFTKKNVELRCEDEKRKGDSVL